MSMHLSAEQLIDAADGTIPESSLPHLASCARCRGELTRLRTTMSAIVADDAASVPAPPPMFWDRFRRDINEAIAGDAPRAVLPWRLVEWVRTPAFLLSGAAAAAVLVLALQLRTPPADEAAPVARRIDNTSGTSIASASELPADPLSDSGLDEDPSLQLVAELTTTIDVEAARDAGLVATGSAEHAVTHMNEDELR
jgi:hypothetical protein